jgi:hypothetical protein
LEVSPNGFEEVSDSVPARAKGAMGIKFSVYLKKKGFQKTVALAKLIQNGSISRCYWD